MNGDKLCEKINFARTCHIFTCSLTSFRLKFKTCFKYVGSWVRRVYQPQFSVVCATMIAQTGMDLNMSFHGVFTIYDKKFVRLKIKNNNKPLETSSNNKQQVLINFYLEYLFYPLQLCFCLSACFFNQFNSLLVPL